jgi:hypothetical protein
VEDGSAAVAEVELATDELELLLKLLDQSVARSHGSKQLAEITGGWRMPVVMCRSRPHQSTSNFSKDLRTGPGMKLLMS